MKHNNRITILDAVRRLNLGRDDVFLEIGPGHGVALHEAVAKFKPKRLLAVELSERFRALLTADPILNAAGLELSADDCCNLPFGDSEVDKLLAVNVAYFLNPIEKYCKEFFRVLSQGGRLILACKFYALPASPTFVIRDQEVVVAALQEAGFKNISEQWIELNPSICSYTAIIATK